MHLGVDVRGLSGSSRSRTLSEALRWHYRDVPLGDGRTLRVGIYTEDAVPQDLVIASGRGQGAEWREDPAEGIEVPAQALPALVEALTVVGEEVEIRRMASEVYARLAAEG